MATVAQAFDEIRAGGRVRISDPDGFFMSSDFYRKNGNIYAYNSEMGEVSRTDWDLSDLADHFDQMQQEGFILSLV